jgi:hypothetical protein
VDSWSTFWPFLIIVDNLPAWLLCSWLLLLFCWGYLYGLEVLHLLWSCWLLVFGISFWCCAWLVVSGDAFALVQGVFWVSSVLSIGCAAAGSVCFA